MILLPVDTVTSWPHYSLDSRTCNESCAAHAGFIGAIQSGVNEIRPVGVQQGVGLRMNRDAQARPAVVLAVARDV